MSATNRGSKRKDSDFYPTPISSIEAILDNFDLSKRGDEILEPSAGNGNICSLVKKRYPNKCVTALELREEEEEKLEAVADEVIIGDFFKLNSDKKYDVIIGNPPYSLAIEFV